MLLPFSSEDKLSFWFSGSVLGSDSCSSPEDVSLSLILAASWNNLDLSSSSIRSGLTSWCWSSLLTSVSDKSFKSYKEIRRLVKLLNLCASDRTCLHATRVPSTALPSLSYFTMALNIFSFPTHYLRRLILCSDDYFPKASLLGTSSIFRSTFFSCYLKESSTLRLGSVQRVSQTRPRAPYFEGWTEEKQNLFASLFSRVSAQQVIM